MRERREVMIGVGLRDCGNIRLGNRVWLNTMRQQFELIVHIRGGI
jgi:hypothetical protein